MDKKNLYAALCMIGLLMLPLTGMARMTQLSEAQLGEVTDQAGIVNEADGMTYMTFDNHMDYMPVMGGLLNFSDVTIQGAIQSRNQSSVTTATLNQLVNNAIPGMGIMSFGMSGLAAMGIGTHTIDTTIDVNRLSVGAIRIGQDTTGPSLGSLDIIGMHTSIQGTVSISVR